MKEKLFLLGVCLVLLLVPIVGIIAQEEDDGGGAAAVEQEAAPAGDSAPAAKPAQQSTGKVSAPPLDISARGLAGRIVFYISQIGGIFGQATGLRIGGPTVTAILTLIIAKVLEDKVPPWVKYVLYAGGGTMIAGGSANIAELAMALLK
jgi:hypothetical protein